jgi:hypothetical protein
MAGIEVINSDMLTAQLSLIPRRIRTAIERQALTEASELAVEALRANTPEETGALRRSLAFDIRKWHGGTVVAGIIGAD